jgi:hypothetical protein
MRVYPAAQLAVTRSISKGSFDECKTGEEEEEEEEEEAKVQSVDDANGRLSCFQFDIGRRSALIKAGFAAATCVEKALAIRKGKGRQISKNASMQDSHTCMAKWLWLFQQMAIQSLLVAKVASAERSSLLL